MTILNVHIKRGMKSKQKVVRGHCLLVSVARNIEHYCVCNERARDENVHLFEEFLFCKGCSKDSGLFDRRISFDALNTKPQVIKLKSDQTRISSSRSD